MTVSVTPNSLLIYSQKKESRTPGHSQPLSFSYLCLYFYLLTMSHVIFGVI